MDVEEIHEIDEDGAAVGFMGWLIRGHLSDFEIELFMADDWAEEVAHLFYGERGFDVEHVYARKIPYRNGGWLWRYQDNPGPGAYAATRIEVNTNWEKWCVNHPDEEATTGFPVSRVLDPDPASVDNGHVYMCRPCATDFNERTQEARRRALAEMKINS